MKRKLHIQARQEHSGIYKTRLKTPKPGEKVPIPQEPVAPLAPLPALATTAAPAAVAVSAVKPNRRPVAVAAVSCAALLLAVLVPARSVVTGERGWMSPRRVVAAPKPVPPPPPDAKVWAAAPAPRSVPVAPPAVATTPAVTSFSGDMPLFDDGRVYVGE